ncbi:UDP-2,4-diacetamido-2,4,6-trideoxy-beta-L-altropyranose hydrolase [Billgrantia diversa]|uniref:UDP-2,4-diacetamido-2,4, 6-trideoxy-beta-L-altropyranose hydrolase n=1 Tax=Halomonas sp. MCCC 1A13316 TaxID=2733487 RepID=UPI0018D27B02|nr:UDP-2,4-diacetamido-2,4,6-trideoxy-beta-L-altropyranose hydrolase [Halomonas sp. MCCC 1A13316]
MSNRPDASRGKIVAIRADASLEIGTGHIMRCLTLARALRDAGAECHFLCREHPGNLIDMIQADGFVVHRLPRGQREDPSQSSPDRENNWEVDHEIQPSGSRGLSEHADWLGVHWQADARACRTILEGLAPDWLIVDHYALDACWEAAVLPQGTRLLVIDDLADRPHIANILLDQNLGRRAADYEGLVPENCQLLIGPRYALLRPEFAAWREPSLKRRHTPQIRHLLITLGGVDQDNITGRVLEVLSQCSLPDNVQTTVVMGATAPWLDNVRAKAGWMPWPTEVAVNIDDMARRMAEADLAIGAAGSTSWERCCLGLPTVMVALAENQVAIAHHLDEARAAICVGTTAMPTWAHQLGQVMEMILKDPTRLEVMTNHAAGLTEGLGACTLVQHLLNDD